MDGERVQFLDQRAAFVVGHADDVFRVIAEKQAFAPGFGMRAHDRMVDRRLRQPLRLGERILAVAPVAREVEVVHGAQVGDARLPRRVEALVGAVHVAEMRLAAALRHDLAVDDRRLPGDALPGAVGVPGQRALVGVLAVGLPFRSRFDSR